MHSQIIVIVIARVSAIRVDSNIETSTKASESAQPSAEALTLVLHKFAPASKVRPLRVISSRNDDVVHVYHSRSKRKPSSNSRKRRPSSQFRSKIKSSSSNFGGFKDFPPFNNQNKNNFGEPTRPKTSSKNKFVTPPQPFDGYSCKFRMIVSLRRSKRFFYCFNFQSMRNRRTRNPEKVQLRFTDRHRLLTSSSTPTSIT